MEYVERARAESERGEIVLRQRIDPGPGDSSGDSSSTVLELRVNGAFVMDTFETSSERGLAEASLEHVENPRDVLVAGLGLGFTAHEVLADQRVERLVVVEIEDALVGWMRDGTIPHGPQYLADERLTVISTDIRSAIAEATPATYDLVLIDVDNGPDFLVHEDNEQVYAGPFLGRLQQVLRPGGVLAVWSASESAALQKEMEGTFDNAVAVPYDVTLQTREEQYWLYLSRAT